MNEELPGAQELVVRAADGAKTTLLLLPAQGVEHACLYWLPAMGVAARHYLPLAEQLTRRGITVALHEWRGIGSSDRRAGQGSNWGYRQLLQADLPAGLTVAREHRADVRWWLGGHSLGGQLACLFASQQPDHLAGLALVASGAPYWRVFPRGVWIGVAYLLAPWLARLWGYFPGRRLGFGGNEAAGVIADWARSGRSGRYAAAGLGADLERDLAALRLPVLGLSLSEDWLAPPPSLDWLLGKMPAAPATRLRLGRAELDGRRADHFGWMKTPQAVADRLAAFLR